jgi:hypothetical protein
MRFASSFIFVLPKSTCHPILIRTVAMQCSAFGGEVATLFQL